jgi:hypothetical protein
MLAPRGASRTQPALNAAFAQLLSKPKVGTLDWAVRILLPRTETTPRAATKVAVSRWRAQARRYATGTAGGGTGAVSCSGARPFARIVISNVSRLV